MTASRCIFAAAAVIPHVLRYMYAHTAIIPHVLRHLFAAVAIIPHVLRYMCAHTAIIPYVLRCTFAAVVFITYVFRSKQSLHLRINRISNQLSINLCLVNHCTASQPLHNRLACSFVMSKHMMHCQSIASMIWDTWVGWVIS